MLTALICCSVTLGCFRLTCGVILRVVRKCVLSMAESISPTESFILIDFKMSKQEARPAKPQNDQMKVNELRSAPLKRDSVQPHMSATYVQPRTQQQDDSFPSQPQRSWDVGTSNVSTATFSSMSKQAESLVNGGNNVVFNPYNNNLVFQWVSMSMNDCLSIDRVWSTVATMWSSIRTTTT